MNLKACNTQGAETEGTPKAKWAALADWLIPPQALIRPDVAAERECGAVPDQLPGMAVFA